MIFLATGLAACGGSGSEAPGAATQRGIDRSVADIRAAEAAAQKPVVVSKSVGELTGKASADAGESKPKAKAAAPAPEAEAPAPAAG
jgi:hypothetical protein